MEDNHEDEQYELYMLKKMFLKEKRGKGGVGCLVVFLVVVGLLLQVLVSYYYFIVILILISNIPIKRLPCAQTICSTAPKLFKLNFFTVFVRKLERVQKS